MSSLAPGQPAPSGFYSGVALAVGGTFLFALKSIVVKLAFAAGANPTELLALRMTMALPFYLATLAWLPDSPTRPRSAQPQTGLVIRAALLGFLGYYLASYLDLCGLAFISAQLERLTLFTYPAIVAVLAWLFLNESLGPRVLLAIALSYSGIALMYGQEKLISSDQHSAWGVFLVMGSAVSYALYVLLAKPTMLRLGSRRFTSLAMIGSTGFVWLHFLATQPPGSLLSLPPVVYLHGIFLAFVCTVIPSFMINESIVRIGATRTTVIGSVGPVLTMMLAIAILDEPSTWQHFAGMAVAICGVSLVAKK